MYSCINLTVCIDIGTSLFPCPGCPFLFGPVAPESINRVRSVVQNVLPLLTAEQVNQLLAYLIEKLPFISEAQAECVRDTIELITPLAGNKSGQGWWWLKL